MNKVIATALASSLLTLPVLAGSGKVTTSASKGDSSASGAAEGWELTAAGGLSLSKGNTEALSYSAQVLASYLDARNELYLGADYFYGETDEITNTDSFRAFANYNRLITDRFYLGALGEYFTDDAAAIDSRITAGATLGYYLVKSPTTKFAIEAGAAQVWEEQGGLDRDFTALRIAERFEYKPNDSVTLWQSAVWTPEFDDFNSYTLVGEIGITSPISDHLALRVFVRDTYDSTPAAGADENDITVAAGLAWSAKPFEKAAPTASVRRSLKPKKGTPAAPIMGWTTTGNAGVSLTSGNSETLLVTAGIDSAHRSKTDELFLNIGGAYGEISNSVNAQNLSAGFQYNRLFTERVYGGVSTGFLYDDVAGVDYSVTPAGLIGAYLIKSDTVSLSLDGGPGYTFEKVGGIKADYFSLTATQKFEWLITEGLKFTQSVRWITEAEDFDNYTLVAGAALEAELTDALSLRIAATDRYDNTPAAGREENDLTLSTGVAIKF